MTADTNVFIYAADHREPLKQAAATRIVAVMRSLCSPIALQLVGEFQNAVRRKLKTPSARAAALGLDLVTDYPTFPYGEAAVLRALDECAHGRLSYWDALMLASAAEAGCTVMLSEDMQDGQIIFGLEIVNPFGADGVSPRAAELLELA